MYEIDIVYPASTKVDITDPYTSDCTNKEEIFLGGVWYGHIYQGDDGIAILLHDEDITPKRLVVESFEYLGSATTDSGLIALTTKHKTRLRKWIKNHEDEDGSLPDSFSENETGMMSAVARTFTDGQFDLFTSAGRAYLIVCGVTINEACKQFSIGTAPIDDFVA